MNIFARAILQETFFLRRNIPICYYVPPTDLKESNVLKKSNVETLEDVLMFLNIFPDFEILDSSLEELRNHQQSKESYEEVFKNFDKKLKKISLKCHPDKVENRGCSHEELELYYNLQITLNAMRKIFTVLNETFLENINMDNRFSHYAKLNISSLRKECDIKNRVYEVLFKISSISEVKAQKVIPEIRQFLTESETCIAHFLGNNISEFKECRNLALVHLENCIKGYDNLLEEITNVEKKCRNENMDFIYDSMERMRSEHAKNISHLKEIKSVAEISLFKRYEIFSTAANLDEYYVSPFASYINAMAMCSVMMGNRNRNIFDLFSAPVCIQATSSLLVLHSLTQFYLGRYKEYRKTVKSLLDEIEQPFTDEGIRKLFRYELSKVKRYLENKFRVSNYHIENFERCDVVLEHKKCIQMLSKFKAREEELKSEIKRLACRNQDLEEKGHRAVKQIEEFYIQEEKQTDQTKIAPIKESPFKKSYLQTL